MHLWNADGSRAEMSGNGIRCLGQAVAGARDDHEADLRRGAPTAASATLVVHDDADHRLAQVQRRHGPGRRRPRRPAAGVRAASPTPATPPPTWATRTSWCSSPTSTASTWSAPAPGSRRQFAGGINVEFIAPGGDADTLDLRVWERGAGVTEACGTGAAAAAHRPTLGPRRPRGPGRDARRLRRGRLAPDDGRATSPCSSARRSTWPPSRSGRRAALDARRRRVDAADLDERPTPDGYDDPRARRRASTATTAVESHRGAFGEFGGETRRLIERTFRERIVLVGVTLPAATTRTTPSATSTSWPCWSTPPAPTRSARVVQRRDRPDPATYIGKGKVAELQRAAPRPSTPTSSCSTTSSRPAQQRNLEKLLGRTAIDRTAVILDIFAQNAHSQEGKAQVELAQLRYRLPRLRGKGKSASASRRGGIGTRRGPGETQLEVDRRRILRRIAQARARPRATSGAHRDTAAQGPPAQPASHRSRIVGYTNAGKSTLLNRLTDAGVLVEDRLFATLDATTRRLAAPRRRDRAAHRHRRLRAQAAPPAGARRSSPRSRWSPTPTCSSTWSTRSAPDPEGQIDAVHAVLGEIGAGDGARAAGVQQDRPPTPRRPSGSLAAHPGSVAISARTGEGIDDAAAHAIGDRLRALDRSSSCVVPYERGDVLAALHREGEVLVEAAADDGMRVRARLDDASAVAPARVRRRRSPGAA